MADTSFVSEKATGILIPSGYKAGTLYGIVPDNQYTTGTPENAFDFTFARSSIATRTNEAGLIETMANDVPRLQYPSCPSCLLEPTRTNLAKWSEDFQQWGNINIGITTGIIAPDGSTNAQNLEVLDNPISNRVEQSITVTPSVVKYASVYIKAGSQNVKGGRLYISGSVNHIINFAPTNEWVRYTLEIPSTDTATSITFRIYISLTGGAVGDNLQVWGAQVKLGTYPTTYIKTEGATANRAVDSISLSGLQTNGILGANGTYYCSIQFINNGLGTGKIEIADVTRSNRLNVYQSGTTNMNFQIMANSVNLVSQKFALINDEVSFVFKYDNTDTHFFFDGAKVGIYQGVIGANLTDLKIVIDTMSVKLHELQMYPTALTDGECIELSKKKV